MKRHKELPLLARVMPVAVFIAFGGTYAYMQTVNTVPKYNGSGNLVTSNISEVSGRVGIGTTSPIQLLHVFSDSGSAAAIVESSAGTASIQMRSAGNAVNGLFFYKDGNPRAAVRYEGSDDSLRIRGSSGTSSYTDRMIVTSAGDIGIGTNAPAAKLHVVGDVQVTGNIAAKYQDVAEWVRADEPMEPGTVVLADPERNDHVVPASVAYDTSVAGVVSAQPGILLGESSPGKIAVAQSGRVRVKVDGSFGEIRRGDLLVTSTTPGHAMVSRPLQLGELRIHRPGTIVGKALEPWRTGRGEILMLVTLQ